jgi:hypothetical protein
MFSLHINITNKTRKGLVMKFELNIEKIKERILSHQVLSKEEAEILNKYIEFSNTEVYEWNVKVDEYTGRQMYYIGDLVVFEDEIIKEEDKYKINIYEFNKLLDEKDRVPKEKYFIGANYPVGYITRECGMDVSSEPPYNVLLKDYYYICASINEDKKESKFIYCNGSEISREEYKDLFNIISVKYGEGNGATTFNLPNPKEIIADEFSWNGLIKEDLEI